MLILRYNFVNIFHDFVTKLYKDFLNSLNSDLILKGLILPENIITFSSFIFYKSQKTE